MIKKMPQERYIFPQERLEIIDKLRLKQINTEYQKTTKISKNVQQNNLETVKNKNDKEIPKKRHIPAEKIQKFIDNSTFNIIV